MGRHLSPRYGQVILVSGYLVLTAVNWSQHWCPICVSVFLCFNPKLARNYEIEHWSRCSKTINWSADSFQINHVTSMSWHMSRLYGQSWDTGQWLSCFDSGQLTILWMSNVKDVDLPRHAWDTPPFLLMVSSTPPVQSLDAYLRSVNHVTTKRKEVDHIRWIWG